MNITYLLVAAVLVLGIGGYVLASGGDTPTGQLTAEQLDSFAQCLSENNATFYGAYWCPHCKTQKAMFGDAMQEVDYVECSPDGRNAPRSDACVRKGISTYPTWIIEGERYTGVQSFQELSSATGCQLPQ